MRILRSEKLVLKLKANRESQPKMKSAQSFLLLVIAMLTKAENGWIDEEVLMKCKEQENSSDEDLQTISSFNQPETYSAKCLLACTMEKDGFVSDFWEQNFLTLSSIFQLNDGAYDSNAFEEYVKSHVNLDPESTQFSDLITNTQTSCESVADDDRCELALKVAQCQESAFKLTFGIPEDADLGEILRGQQ